MFKTIIFSVFFYALSIESREMNVRHEKHQKLSNILLQMSPHTIV